MLVESLLDLMFDVFCFFFGDVSVPDFPDEVLNVLLSIEEYLSSGLAFVAAYTHLPYLLTLFSIALVVDAVILTYRIVMWILRKIPLISVS